MIDHARLEGPTIVHVKPYGRKFKCIFCFSQGALTKIYTAEKLNEIRKDSNYKVVASR